MATSTLGTNATTSLTALIHAGNGAGQLPADIAAIAQAIKDDKQAAIAGGAGTNPNISYYGRSGLLYVPRRGVLKVSPGDYVAVDSTGWPILISAQAIAAGPWTHT